LNHQNNIITPARTIGMKALCATDLSAASNAAIETETCLECLGRIGVEEMHLITVIPSNVHAGMPGINFEKRRRTALKRYTDVIEDAGFGVETHVVRGTPHRRINGIADTIDADLTIVGSRGKSPLENRVIGSTARNLARTTVAPLLVNRIEREVNDPEVLRKHLFRRMLYATDFSENADRAFEAFSYLRHATQEATLVHVTSPKDPGPGGEAGPEERLGELADRLETWDIATETTVRRGDPAAEILAAEATHRPTTTLLGARGQSRLRRLLLGSVSEDVVAQADGNVLLVPPTSR
jgi:nucleotide-binding universal stress UspA family protein